MHVHPKGVERPLNPRISNETVTAISRRFLCCSCRMEARQPKGVDTMRCDPFYVAYGTRSKFYHDDDECPFGKRIKPCDRVPGQGSRFHCWVCESLHADEGLGGARMDPPVL